MSDESSDNKNKTISFRVQEEKFEKMQESDHSLSAIYRGMTDMFIEEPFFEEGVEAVLDGDADSFEEYSMSQVENSAEEFAEQVTEQLERPVDAAELKEPLVNYALNAAAGYRTGTYEAVDQVRQIDDSLGNGLERATARFPQQYWDEALE